MKVKVYYHHTDAGGVVYYARYLEFLEEARTEYFESKGIVLKELAKKDILFVVSRQEIDYKSPAFYADTLDISTQVSRTSGVRLEFVQDIKNEAGRTIASAKTVLVSVDRTFKPRPIPEEVSSRLT
ncbi:MAG: hypothetical protein A2987_01275 [Omnitrophica bacterium RIFCSPLOWO2_01_FULL_45_10]|nr:MAG: hypothetical protein A2987_01275 [Omnitrophica bacterium RIFCSPLOWO2_01_FULL_45_10]